PHPAREGVVASDLEVDDVRPPRAGPRRVERDGEAAAAAVRHLLVESRGVALGVPRLRAAVASARERGGGNEVARDGRARGGEAPCDERSRGEATNDRGALHGFLFLQAREGTLGACARADKRAATSASGGSLEMPERDLSHPGCVALRVRAFNR